MLALRAAQGRQAAEGEVDAACLERLGDGVVRQLPRLDVHAGRLAPPQGHQRRQEFLGADVAHVHDEAALRARRVEAVGLVDRQLERLERRLDLAREGLGLRRGRHAAGPRTNSGSCKASRRRVSAWLTAGCERPSASAARLTLPACAPPGRREAD